MRNIISLIILVIFCLTVFQKGLSLTFETPHLSQSNPLSENCLCAGVLSENKEVQYQKFVMKSHCESKERLNYLSLLKYDFIYSQTAAVQFLSQTGSLFIEDQIFQSALRSSPDKVPKV